MFQVDELRVPIAHLIPDDQYIKLLSELNNRQRKYLLHVLNRLKTNGPPLRECVLGGAGVGKSRLILALQQSITRLINARQETPLEATKVILSAFTGKAAFAIRGATLHSLFVLPFSQKSGEIAALSSNVCNTIHSQMHAAEVVIIDEVSMLGSRMFNQVNTRMKQIFATTESFGGKSVIVFGDFNQLPPVGDSPVYKADPTNPYATLMGSPLWEEFRLYELTEV